MGDNLGSVKSFGSKGRVAFRSLSVHPGQEVVPRAGSLTRPDIGQQASADRELRIARCRPEDVVTYRASCSKCLEGVRIEADRPKSFLAAKHDVAGTDEASACAFEERACLAGPE